MPDMQLTEEAIKALEAVGVYEDRGTDDKNTLVALMPDETGRSDGVVEEAVQEIPSAMVPMRLRPLQRPRTRIRGQLTRRSPLSRKGDGAYEHVFAGYRCRVDGCRFVASTLQHVQHHEQTSSHRDIVYPAKAATVQHDILDDYYDDPFSDDKEVF